jgi:hypothetical protein
MEVVGMRSSWRSVFWNVIAAICLGTMAAICVGVTVDEAARHEWPGVAILVCFGLWLGYGTLRCPFVGVYARPQGVVTRGPFLTRAIPWDQMLEFSGGTTTGPAGGLGARTVTVAYQPPGATVPRKVPLNTVGVYWLRRGETPADRALVDLRKHLALQLDGLTGNRQA